MAENRTDTADREIVITRIINAPQTLVFDVWTDAQHLGEWWGPNGFTITTHSREMKVGGTWRFTMHGPDGTDYPNRVRYTEIVKPELIRYTHDTGIDNDPQGFEVTVTFEREGEKTRLTLRSLFSSVAQRTLVVEKYGAIEGGNQTISRFEAQLEKSLAGAFTIERTLNAPAEKVWSAITNRDEMSKWYFDLAEFRPVVGFEFEFMGGTEDNQYRHLCEVTEVIPGKKITYSWRYDGYSGNSFVSFELIPEGNKTKLVLTHVGLDTFPSTNKDFAKDNFAMGWAHIIGTSLPEYLEKA